MNDLTQRHRKISICLSLDIDTHTQAYTFTRHSMCVFNWSEHHVDNIVCVGSGIEIDDDKLGEGDSDFTIRGRLMSLVEKVAYLRKKMADMPKKKKAKKPSKYSA